MKTLKTITLIEMESEVEMDGRVSPGMFLEKRKPIVDFFKKGMRLKDIFDATGLCWQAVRKTIDLYERYGGKGLESGRRGRPAGKGRVVKDVRRKVFFVMDNLKVYHCDPVKAWLGAHGEQIEVFCLPSHGPELNPDERPDADLKHAITTSVPKRTRASLLAKTKEHMDMEGDAGTGEVLLQEQARQVCGGINVIHCRNNKCGR